MLIRQLSAVTLLVLYLLPLFARAEDKGIKTSYRDALAEFFYGRSTTECAFIALQLSEQLREGRLGSDLGPFGEVYMPVSNPKAISDSLSVALCEVMLQRLTEQQAEIRAAYNDDLLNGLAGSLMAERGKANERIIKNGDQQSRDLVIEAVRQGFEELHALAYERFNNFLAEVDTFHDEESGLREYYCLPLKKLRDYPLTLRVLHTPTGVVGLGLTLRTQDASMLLPTHVLIRADGEEIALPFKNFSYAYQEGEMSERSNAQPPAELIAFLLEIDLEEEFEIIFLNHDKRESRVIENPPKDLLKRARKTLDLYRAINMFGL